MKIKVWLGINISGCRREDILEIDEKELDGMSEDEQEEWIFGYVEDWANQYINIAWKEIE